MSLQTGQCGNQVALQYWNQLALEHGIQADGNPHSTNQYTQTQAEDPHKSFDPSEALSKNVPEKTDVFFTYSEQNKYTPRSILIDLEPSVIGKCLTQLPMFNHRNVHLSDNGTGAANNWQHGHVYASQHEEDLMNLVDRELDKCDNFSAFQLFHSVAGGTGSGLGSYLLELLSDRYGSKKLLTTFLIFPSNDKTSDVVVQPYNTVLTLKRLIDFSDATFVYDNDSLNLVESLLLSSSRSSRENQAGAFQNENKLIAYIASGVSNPLRFPSYMHSSYESIISTLVPTPDLKFLSSAIAPFSNIPGTMPRSKHTSLKENDIIMELLNDKYKMNHVGETPKYISMLDYIVGNTIDQQELRKAAIRAQQRILFVPWTSSSINFVNGRQLPHVPRQAAHENELSGYQISNNTSITQLLSKIVRQYDLLARRAAYINFYTETNDKEERSRVLDSFNECKESVLATIDEYRACTSLSYLEDEFLDDEEMMV